MQYSRAFSALLVLALGLSRPSPLDAQLPTARAPASSGVPSQAASAFLRAWIRAGADGESLDSNVADSETWAIAAALPLQRGQLRAEAVYLTGRPWCGTGGCTLVIVTEDSASKVHFAGDVSLSQLPIRLLTTRHGGWPDLGVSVFGGGEAHPHLALFRFDADSQRYQGESTAELPAVPLTQRQERALITDAMPETRLWPREGRGTLVQRCLVVVPTAFGRFYTHRRCPTRS